jgi:hypothetical protein
MDQQDLIDKVEFLNEPNLKVFDLMNRILNHVLIQQEEKIFEQLKFFDIQGTFLEK